MFISVDLLKIIWPFILFVILFVVCFILNKRFNKNIDEIIKLFRSAKIDRNKINNEIINYPSVIYGYGEKNGESIFISFEDRNKNKGNVLFIDKHIPSGWSFYSTVIMIKDLSIADENIIFSRNELNGIHFYVRDIKKRKNDFVIVDNSFDNNSIPSALHKYKEFINYCFSINDKVMLDFYNGNVIAIFYGKFFSNILKAKQIENVFEKLNYK